MPNIKSAKKRMRSSVKKTDVNTLVTSSMKTAIKKFERAVKEGNKENADLVSATVSLKTSVCPECGRSYVSGGTTNTTIKYSESNPYEKNRKLLEGSFLKGQVIDSYL